MNQDVVRIITGQKIVKDMKRGCLCTVLQSICQLKSMPQIVLEDFFLPQQFSYERQVWYRRGHFENVGIS